jgi:MFS family permease
LPAIDPHELVSDIATGERRDYPGLILAALSLANVIALLDMFVVNVALHDIAVDLHDQSSLSDVAWVLNAYALVFGSLLVPAGRFADRYGRKATFQVGLALFTAASLACAASPTLWTLVAFRCLQALGAAMFIPSSLGLVLTTLPPERTRRGVRVWAVSGTAAGSIGPVVGGLLTSLSWRWIFVVNLPIGLVAMAVIWRLIPDVRHDRSTRVPDLLGSLMAIVAIGAVSLALLSGPGSGWGSIKIIASWAAAAAAGAAFVAQKMNDRIPVGVIVTVGFGFIAVGQVLTVLSIQHGVHRYADAVMPGWVLCGVGFGLSFPTVIGSGTSDLSPKASATGSAVINSSCQIGAVLGASVVVAVLGRAGMTGDSARFYQLWWVAAALCAPAALGCVGLSSRDTGRGVAAGDAAS